MTDEYKSEIEQCCGYPPEEDKICETFGCYDVYLLLVEIERLKAIVENI